MLLYQVQICVTTMPLNKNYPSPTRSVSCFPFIVTQASHNPQATLTINLFSITLFDYLTVIHNSIRYHKPSDIYIFSLTSLDDFWFEDLINIAAMTIICRPLCGHIFSFLQHKLLDVELQSLIVSAHLIFEKKKKKTISIEAEINVWIFLKEKLSFQPYLVPYIYSILVLYIYFIFSTNTSNIEPLFLFAFLI